MTATYLNTRDDAISAIDEALAELPHCDDCGGFDPECPLAQPAQQQEPVAKVCHDLDGHIGWNPKLTQLPDEGTSLYTSPQSKPWVGLEESEWREIDDRHDWTTTQGRIDAAEEIEAKLREKNA